MDVLLALLADVETPALPAPLRPVLVWSRLHGLVSLELGGNFASMGLDADELFEAELRALLPA